MLHAWRNDRGGVGVLVAPFWVEPLPNIRCRRARAPETSTVPLIVAAVRRRPTLFQRLNRQPECLQYPTPRATKQHQALVKLGKCLTRASKPAARTILRSGSLRRTPESCWRLMSPAPLSRRKGGREIFVLHYQLDEKMNKMIICAPFFAIFGLSNQGILRSKINYILM
jgi:hypothetical protein